MKTASDEKWNDALSRGHKTEEIVFEKVLDKYPRAYRINGYDKRYDIYVPEKGVGIEVKTDESATRTGNVAIEYQDNGYPSGIMTTEATYWVYYFGGKMYWVDRIKLLSHLIENTYTVKRGNEGTMCVLIPLDEFVKIVLR